MGSGKGVSLRPMGPTGDGSSSTPTVQLQVLLFALGRFSGPQTTVQLLSLVLSPERLEHTA